MADTVTTIKHYSSGLTLGVEREHSLSLEEKPRYVKSFKENFRSANSVLVRVQRSFRKQNRVLLGRDIEFLVDMSP